MPPQRMPKVDEEALVFSEHVRGAMYSRTWSRSREKLESALLELYGLSLGRHQALLLPSGMAAIGATLAAVANSRSKEPWTLVYGSELYCEVPRTVHYVADSCGTKVSCVSVDITNVQELLELFRKRGKTIGIFHFEACTNPSGQFWDFQILGELRKLAPECVFICDNTWLSGALFNPLEHGADLVVESLTKYVSAGRCIGGAVLGVNSLMAPILSWIKAFGMFVAADHCELFLDSLKSLRARMQATSQQMMAAHLEAHPAVNRVMYPLLASHPTASVATRYLVQGLGPGCIWFHVSAKKQYIMKLLTSSAAPECKTSFGARQSRLDPWPKAASSSSYDRSDQTKGGREGTWLRLSVGFEEEPAALVHAMNTFLSQLAASPGSPDQVVPLVPSMSEGRWRRKT